MKKEYIIPAIKVRQIDGEGLMNIVSNPMEDSGLKTDDKDEGGDPMAKPNIWDETRDADDGLGSKVWEE